MGRSICGNGTEPVEIKIGTCRVVLDFGFPAALCIAFLWGDDLFLVQCMTVCILHELGHGLAMWATHAGVREIHLHAAGMQMRTHTACLSKASLLCIYLSGPAANLLLAGLFWCIRPETALLHLCMGCFNLLPYRVLDGGAALGCLLEKYPRVQMLVHGICLCLSAGTGLVLWRYGLRNPALYLMAVYLGVAEVSGGRLFHSVH